MNLSEQTDVVNLMESSKSEEEWNTNCDKVKRANGNNYPEFWYRAIISSGLLRKVTNRWTIDGGTDGLVTEPRISRL